MYKVLYVIIQIYIYTYICYIELIIIRNPWLGDVLFSCSAPRLLGQVQGQDLRAKSSVVPMMDMPSMGNSIRMAINRNSNGKF